jgi:hypothetical protein
MLLFFLMLEFAILLAHIFSKVSWSPWTLFNLHRKNEKYSRRQLGACLQRSTFALSLFLVFGLSRCFTAEGGDGDALKESK